MRPFTIDYLNAADTLLGTQTNIQIICFWPTGIIIYSDIPDYGQATIIQLGALRQEFRKITSIGTFTFELADSDGYLQQLASDALIEGTYVVVNSIIKNPSDSISFITIASGNIVGASVWSEGNRSLKISCETLMQSKDVGYAPTTLDWSDLSPDASGVPWPFCFGNPIHVRSHRIKKKSCGTLAIPIEFLGDVYSINTTNYYTPYFDSTQLDTVSMSDVNTPITSFPINEGENFPRGSIKILVNKCAFQGSFNGNIFTFTDFNVPLYSNVAIDGQPNTPNQPLDRSVFYLSNVTPLPQLTNHYIFLSGPYLVNKECFVIKQEGVKCTLKDPADTYLNGQHTIQETRLISKYWITDNEQIPAIFKSLADETAQRRTNFPNANNYNAFSKTIHLMHQCEKFLWQAFPNDVVTYWDPNVPDIYICNMIETNEIISVYGFQRVDSDTGGGSERKFVQIPSQWYTPALSVETINGHNVTGILFYKSLKEYGTNWEDDVIYVTLQSSVDQNAADILAFLITNYTNFGVDETSYARVQGQVENFPCNFALYEVYEAERIIEEIAYQARIGLVYDGAYVHMQSLEWAPPETLYITENDVVFKSLEQTTTTIAECIKEIDCTFRESYRPIENHTTQYKAREEHVYYIASGLITNNKIKKMQCLIYNNRSLVQAMVNFWGYRETNVWKLFRLKIFLVGTLLYPLDGFILNSLFILNLVGELRSVSMDMISGEISILIWYPVTL